MDFFHTERQCREREASDEELSVIDTLFQRSESLSENERVSLFYIAGYICFKEGVTNSESESISPFTEDTSYEFTH